MSTYTIDFQENTLEFALMLDLTEIYVRQTCKRQMAPGHDYTHNDSKKVVLEKGVNTYTLTTDDCKKSVVPGGYYFVHHVDLHIVNPNNKAEEIKVGSSGGHGHNDSPKMTITVTKSDFLG